MDVTGLSAAEIGVIVLSNPSAARNDHAAGSVTLTTKDSYFLIPIVHAVLHRNPSASEAAIEQKIVNAFRSAHWQMRAYYLHPWITSAENPFLNDTVSIIIEELEGEHSYNDYDGKKSEISKVSKQTEKSFLKMVKNGLVLDPVFDNSLGTAIAVLGFLPVGFTKRTSDGEEAYFQLRGMLWEFEWKRHRGVRSIEFKLKLAKVLEWLRDNLPREIDKVVEEPIPPVEEKPKKPRKKRTSSAPEKKI